jgi:hypothetical protein
VTYEAVTAVARCQLVERRRWRADERLAALGCLGTWRALVEGGV